MLKLAMLKRTQKCIRCESTAFQDTLLSVRDKSQAVDSVHTDDEGCDVGGGHIGDDVLARKSF